jgi:D-threo-aldose 1-dehydrogenase
MSHRRLTPATLIFGCAPIGNLYRVCSDEDAREALQFARQKGVALFDTAPLYGFGLSETRLERAFGAATSAASSAPQIITKVGRYCVPRSELTQLGPDEAARVERNAAMDAIYPAALDNVVVVDYSETGMRRALAQSRERLGPHLTVACVRIHDAESEERFADLMASDGAGVRALVRMRDAGEFAQLSLGMNSPEFMLRILRAFPVGTFDNVMLAGAYNLLSQSGAQVLAECERLGVAVQLAGVFASGGLWLDDKFRYEPMDNQVRQLRTAWIDFCSEYGVKLQAAALAFAFRPRVVSHVAIGLRSAREVAENLALLDEANAIPETFWHDAAARKLIATTPTDE